MTQPNEQVVLTLAALAALCVVLALSPWDPLRDTAILLAGFATTVAVVGALVFAVYGWRGDAGLWAVVGIAGLGVTALTFRVVRRTERRLRTPHPRPVHR